MQVPSTASNLPEWLRKAATAVNFLLVQREYPFIRLDAAPSDPGEGQSYYDLTLHKARIWDGSTWQNLF